jgi:hypothetical protein
MYDQIYKRIDANQYNKRHNRKCENYRKTWGYPCSSSKGTPCGKCGGVR